MRDHPFVKNIFTLFVILLLSCMTGLLTGTLMVYYQTFPWLKALGMGTIITVIWLTGFYYSWYISEFVKVWQARLVIGVGIQLFSLLVLYVATVSTAFIDEDDLIRQIPILAIFGFVVWVVVMQWYDTIATKLEDVGDSLPELSVPDRESVPEENRVETLSIKSGAHIDIIPVEEIYFIQACGDYVNIFTKDGQFLKEQTMKSLEMALPVSFIRIHRSTIINSMQLLRIELFGKENYHVQLKNGSTLKASLTGYKLLRSRLNL